MHNLEGKPIDKGADDLDKLGRATGAGSFSNSVVFDRMSDEKINVFRMRRKTLIY